jgi:hypothetical protein
MTTPNIIKIGRLMALREITLGIPPDTGCLDGQDIYLTDMGHPALTPIGVKRLFQLSSDYPTVVIPDQRYMI